jgi:vitamin B12 transporter
MTGSNCSGMRPLHGTPGTTTIQPVYMVLQPRWISPIHTEILYLGTELRSERILSSVLGDRMDMPKPVRNERDAFFNYSKDRGQINLTAGNTFIFDSFSAAAGALLSKTGDAGWGLYGGIDVSYALSGSLTWFSSWNQSVRVPSFTEMYYTSPVHRGNPLLKPEKAATTETGLRLGKQGWTGHFAAFRRRGTNIIDWAKTEDALIWETRNISILDTYGLEVEAAWKNRAGGKFPVSEIRGGYAWLNVSKQSEHYISAYVLDYLRHKFVSGITFSVHPNADLVITSIFQDRAGSFTDIDSGFEKPYDPFCTQQSWCGLPVFRGHGIFCRHK